MTPTVELNWSDLAPFDSVDRRTYQHRGVYLWGFEIAGVFMPYYVGIAENVQYRFSQHLSSILSGSYTIYHKDSLKDFISHKDQKASAINPVGKVYQPMLPDSLVTFIRDRELLRPHVDFMLDSLRFSAAKVDDTVNLKELEKLCIMRIGKQKLANTRGGTCVDFVLSVTGDSLVTSLFLMNQ